MGVVFNADNSWKRRKLICECLSPKKDTKSITPESMTQIPAWGGTPGILREWGLDAGSHVAFGSCSCLRRAGMLLSRPGRRGRRGAGLEAPARPGGGRRRWLWRWELLSPLGPGRAGGSAGDVRA